MTGSVVLDVVIGLVFIYLLYSLLASIIQEIIATNLSFRAKILEKAITRMLEDDKDTSSVSNTGRTWIRLLRPNKRWGSHLAKDFYEHPLIKYLGEDKSGVPSYISARNFAEVMIDMMRRSDVKAGENMSSYIEKWLYEENDKSDSKSAKIYLKSLWVNAQGDIVVFKNSLENWFDDMMEHASGWYKQYNQKFLLIIGLGIAIFFNVDTIQITEKLSNDPELRAQIIKQADQFREDHPNLMQEYGLAKKAIQNDSTLNTESRIQALDSTELRYKELKERRDQLTNQAQTLIENDIANVSGLLGLGWSDPCEGKTKEEECKEKCGLAPNGENHWALRILGWFITALALSLGAPFWFDLLNKLMKLRGVVQKSGGQRSAPGAGSASKNATNNIEKRVG